MSKKHSKSGLDNRCRDKDGEIRRKSGTLVGTLRKTYGESFAQGYRGDMKLSTLLERAGSNALSDYLKHHESRSLTGLNKRMSRKSITVLESTSAKFEQAMKKLAEK